MELRRNLAPSNPCQMPAIGITGGISTGKTAFCECLRQILPGAKFFDADQAAHRLAAVEEVKRELFREFGAQIFSGRDLNRAALGAIIFRDAAKKSVLERILHPRIRRQWSAGANRHRKSPNFFFADIPLLYETGGETLCDRVVVVACSPNIQLSSLVERAGIERSVAKIMINSQMPLEEKIKLADHVVWNNGERSLLKAQAASLIELWRKEKWREA
jgi:dephospho-CoA kinase